MEREQIISEIDTKIKYAKFINTDAVVLSSKAAQFCLEHAQYYEQKIKELTEENERLKSVEFTCGFVKPHKVLECPIFDEIARTKADTVRKMHEKILALSTYGTINISPWQLDQIAKEMLESV